jgi:hypothetical protein
VVNPDDINTLTGDVAKEIAALDVEIDDLEIDLQGILIRAGWSLPRLWRWGPKTASGLNWSYRLPLIE